MERKRELREIKRRRVPEGKEVERKMEGSREEERDGGRRRETEGG